LQGIQIQTTTIIFSLPDNLPGNSQYFGQEMAGTSIFAFFFKPKTLSI